MNNSFFSERSAEGRANRHKIFNSYGLPIDAIVFGFFGKIYSGKGVMDLLRAYERLNGDRAALICVGDGSDRTKLERYVRARRIRNVRFTGFVNQSGLPRLYGITDVLVLPSRAENWGLVVNEAMACGCAVLVSDACGCAPDLVQEGVNGFTFPAGNVNALADRMRKLCADPLLVKSMGQASMRIIKDWSPQRCAEQIAHAVRDVVSRHRS